MATRFENLANHILGSIRPWWNETEHRGLSGVDRVVAISRLYCFGEIGETLVNERDSWNRRYTARTIANSLAAVVDEALIGDSPWGELNDVIVAKLRELEARTPETEVMLPVYGLKLKCDGFKVGRVWFRPLTQNRVRAVRARLKTVADETMDTKIAAEKFVELHDKFLAPAVEGVDTVAVVKLAAAAAKAVEMAPATVERALNRFRFLAAGLGRPDARNLSLVRNGGALHYRFGISERGVATSGGWDRLPMDWTAQNTKEMRRAPFRRLWRMFEKDHRALTDLETAVELAIELIGSGVGNSDPALGFLPIVAAFEVFAGSNTPAKQIRETAAFLAGDSLERREQILKDLQQVYHARNEIMHGGAKRPSEADINTAIKTAVATVVGAAKYTTSCSSVPELSEALRRHRLR